MDNNRKLQVENMGQVFTPIEIVSKMISLIDIKDPLILEPSSGNGAFYYELVKKFNNVTSIELDESVAHKGSKIMDFFDFEIKNKFDVVIGNPPYVEFSKIDKNILDKFKTKTIHKPNLYMLFIEKILFHLKPGGEAILIMPLDWLTSTSFSEVRKIFFHNNSITHFQIIEENVWENASVTTAIVKFVNKKNHKNKIDYYLSKNGKIFLERRRTLNLVILLKLKLARHLEIMKDFSIQTATLFLLHRPPKETGP